MIRKVRQPQWYDTTLQKIPPQPLSTHTGFAALRKGPLKQTLSIQPEEGIKDPFV